MENIGCNAEQREEFYTWQTGPNGRVRTGEGQIKSSVHLTPFFAGVSGLIEMTLDKSAPSRDDRRPEGLTGEVGDLCDPLIPTGGAETYWRPGGSRTLASRSYEVGEAERWAASRLLSVGGACPRARSSDSRRLKDGVTGVRVRSSELRRVGAGVLLGLV